jgi:hypothetical protein
MGKKITIAIALIMIAGSLLLIQDGSNGTNLRMRTDLGGVEASFLGEVFDDRAGHYVAGAGDVNGDGYDDILVGAPYSDAEGWDEGQVYLVFGKAAGWAMDTGLWASSASFWGEDASDYAGMSVDGAGDVNGDGYDDILIGAYGDDDRGSESGQTYLIFGKASGWAMDTDLSRADASFRGEDASDFSGYSVAGAGDVNGDGYDDFLIGAWGDEEGGAQAGQTYLVFGKASGWAMDTDLSASSASFLGEDAYDSSGISIAGAGDVNGDGYDDILIGAPSEDDGGTSAGQTYLVFGKASGWAMDTDLSASSASFWGEDSWDQSGCSVSGAGDVNNDGYDDILIGAISNNDGGDGAGQVYLVLGKQSGWAMDTDLSVSSASFWGEEANNSAGCSVAGAGDINGDGYDDIVIGAVNAWGGGGASGESYLVTGKASGWAMNTDLASSTASFGGENSADQSGQCVSGAGDVNGDGYDDLLIGAPYNEELGTTCGQAYLVMPFYSAPAPRNLDARLSEDSLEITITWTTPSRGSPVIYEIYRSSDGHNYEMIAFKLASGGQMSHIDTNIIEDSTYHYVVVATYGAGDSSPMTNAVLVRTEQTSLDSVMERIDELDLKMSAQIYQLRALIESVNESIQVRLFQLGIDLIAFKSDMDAGLSGISASLDANQAELIAELGLISDMIDSLSISLEGMNASMLDSIVSGLTGVSKELAEGDENLSTEIDILLGRLNEYRDDTAHDLQNISALMATIQELETLSQTADRIETDLDTLNALQADVGDIQKEQEDTTSSISLNTILLIVAIVLQIALLIIGMILMMRKRGSGGFPQE